MSDASGPQSPSSSDVSQQSQPAESAPPSISFESLGLPPDVLRAVQDLGYETPSPIQAQSIPPLLKGRDLLGQAQTGTGKTAAFALPLLSRIDLSVRAPQLLVMTPTRELAIQVAEAMQSYAHHMNGFHVLPIYGGQAMHLQLKPLRRGVHAVVGTPGRVLDHLNRATLDVSSLQAVVLDEADEMLRMGFIDDIQEILDHTPEGRQLALFSATMPKPIQKVADGYLDDPVHVKIKAKATTVDTIEQRFVLVRGNAKLDALTRLLETESGDAMIIFVRTKTATTELTEKLEARGFACAALNGDMNQAHREQTVDRLKSGTLDIVVATDVAARGLDVERITHVLNYDIPNDPESYVHRIGRTGRAGASGNAILFVTPRERRTLSMIERVTRSSISELQLPSLENVEAARKARFLEGLGETIDNEDLSSYREIIERFLVESDATALDVAAALAQMGFQSQLAEFVPEASQRGQDRERGRPERGDYRDAPRDFGPRPIEPGMQRFRIEVGRQHNVKVGNIVGAIANEAELDAKHIGHIKLYDSHSTVDLPEGMPDEISEHLQSVWVAGQQLRIRIATAADEQADSGSDRGYSRGRHSNARDADQKPRRNHKDFDGKRHQNAKNDSKHSGKRPPPPKHKRKPSKPSNRGRD